MKRLLEGLRAGMHVWAPTLTGESTLLHAALAADPERASGVSFTAMQFPGIDGNDYLALHPQARQRSIFMTAAMREGLASGRAQLLGLDYLGVQRLLREMPPFDLAVAHLSAPDAQGYCSPGLASDFLPLVWPRARRRVAHINPAMPRTAGSFRVHVSELDAAVHAEQSLLTFIERGGGEIEARIGAYVAGLVRDGSTLQFGIGAIPLALAGALRGHRRLRFHAGMAASALRTLALAGALDEDARVTTGVVLGDAALHDFAARLPQLWMTDISHTHSPADIAQITRFVAINAAVEVDLFGQVNAERVQGAILAGAGGLMAFALGAQASPGGRLVICLPATTAQGRISRIVPVLGDHALCTLPRSLADTVVTEHGVAELRGLTLDPRAQALITIAAPEHRTALAAAWNAIRRRV